MTDGTLKNGECRCGRIRFEISADALMTSVCHCVGCQRMTSSAFSLSTLYPSEALKVTQGEPVIGGIHGAECTHYCCGYCMSWLFTRIAGFDDFVNVRSSLLDNAASFMPFIETFVDTKLPWVTTPAVHKFAEFPTPEEFAELLSEFAER